MEACRAGERAAELPLLDADRDRLAATVEHARHETLIAQAPRLARAQALPRGDVELRAFPCHSGGGV